MSNKQYTLLSVALAAALGIPTALAVKSQPVDRVEPATQPTDTAAGARVIVKYRDGTAAAVDRTQKLRLVESAAGRSGAALASARSGAAALKASHVRQLGVGADLLRLSQPLGKTQLDALVREISADPSVEYAVVDTRDYHLRDAQPQLVPTDPLYAGYQWHFFDPAGGVRAPQAWDIATTAGEGVVVAVLDTGILPAHPDLQANVLPGYDFISDAFVSRRATDDRVPGALDYGDWNPVAGECYTSPSPSPITRSSWHGSHVAGTVAQVTNNGVGVAGLAYNAKVLPVRVLGRCGGYLSDIADAIVWASGGTVPGIPANQNPAEIINMSLGGGAPCDTVYQAAINTAVANGSTVVVAAGNSNANVAGFRPASCANVVAVGATRITGGRASYSNFGPLVDLSGPGGGGNEDAGNDGWDGFVVQSVSSSQTSPDATGATYTYGGKAGTSMAAPHVAGVAALVQGALVAADRDPLSPADLEALLKETARAFPVTIPSGTPVGTGIVDAVAALEKALEEPCDPAVEECAPPATPIVNQVPLRGLSGSGGDTLYSIEVPAGAGGPLSIVTSGGTGNVSLHVSLDEAPSETSYDYRSIRPGNSETVRINAPAAGTYFILLSGTYGNVTLQARYN
ncbi:S8 family serine peptidase [Luteimonas sp. XNQY3]|nr:S8 family peptidase [Luteimonas sp. XNQY3]MCD9006526.1 S8 family serine peptidase [Luteimonas sp. XNQY3]